jgi:sulfur-oxidizing protein SoxB
VLDLDIAKGKVANARYRLLPVFAELLKPDPAMQTLIDKTREPYAGDWGDKIASADRLLYRRGNFSGTTDQLICDALRSELNAEIALSPGFRWGTTTLAGQPVIMDDLLAQTAITYPETYTLAMTGGQIKDVLEDVCDNLFNADPYYQQGGDMVRVGGLAYTCTPAEAVGTDFRIEARRRPHSRSRQKLQGGRMGIRQRAERRAGLGCGCQTSQVGQALQP